MSVLVLHHATGASAVELLAVTGNMNPKLGVSLLLVILFCNNIICAEDQAVDYHWMLVRYKAYFKSDSCRETVLQLLSLKLL